MTYKDVYVPASSALACALHYLHNRKRVLLNATQGI